MTDLGARTCHKEDMKLPVTSHSLAKMEIGPRKVDHLI